MENAIHKTTGKIVSAYKILKSLEWIGKEREDFIAPYHEIGNWQELNNKKIDEVKVSFVIRHKRKLESGEIILVQSHFRIETKDAIENPNNESEEHKLAKENIYDLAIEDLLVVDGKKLSEIGEIEDIRIECQSGKKRADVLIKFKDFHNIYGIGIAFEIQISPQKIEKTEERNYDRASYGYSIVWLWSGELNQSNFKIIPYSEAIKDYHKQLKIQSEKIFWDIDKRTDEKVSEIKERIEKTINSLKCQRELIQLNIQKNLTQLENINETISDKIKIEIRSQVEEKIKNSILDNIKSEKVNAYIEKIYGEYLKNHENYIENLIQGKFIHELGERINKSFSDYKISKVDLDCEIHKTAQLFLKEIDIEEIINKQIKEKENIIFNQLNSIADNKINLLIEKRIEKELSEELLSLKAETITNFSKSRTSLFIECPLCKKDTHIVNTTISKEGDLFNIICNTCKEKKRDEGENKNQNT